MNTSELYNQSASSWQRTGPVLLSDFTARPFLLSRCEPLAGAHVLDLGCGEGYIARQLVARGAAQVLGIDISAAMIDQAIAAGTAEGRIQYQVGTATQPLPVPPASIDLAVAVFLFNYLNVVEMTSVMTQVRHLLRPGGHFLFSVPHPLLAWLRPLEAPFHFDPAGHGYFSARNIQFEGRIWRRDGVSVPVRSVHKTFSDYFSALHQAGFSGLPVVDELHATEEHIAFDPDFFEPLRDVPLHVAFSIRA